MLRFLSITTLILMKNKKSSLKKYLLQKECKQSIHQLIYSNNFEKLLISSLFKSCFKNFVFPLLTIIIFMLERWGRGNPFVNEGAGRIKTSEENEKRMDQILTNF